MATFDAIEPRDQVDRPPRLDMTMPSLHLASDGTGTYGAFISPVKGPGDVLVLQVPIEGGERYLGVYGTRHQLLQLTSELATVVEVGPLGLE